MTRQRHDRYRNAVLGVSVRRADTAKPETVALTASRRGLLEAVAAGKVRYVASSGWRCGQKTVNAVVQDCVRGGWVTASTAMDAETIALTDAGRAAIGDGEPA